jgi:O-antigen biosynthesis protein WbqP
MQATTAVTYPGKRALDIVLALAGLGLALPPMLAIALAVKLTSKGPVLYWSQRVGLGNQLFAMPKFRTMRVDTPAVATHLLADPDRYLTPIGGFLRKTSLDELPQFWNILSGEMSWVGPRPALFNQDDLVEQRSARGVQRLVPGLTGWAQVNGRDELPIPQKVALDAEYLRDISLAADIKILAMTFFKVLRRDGVAH